MTTAIPAITFTLDRRKAVAFAGESIWDVARRMGEELPYLCHRPKPGYAADGNCRACMVEIEGERVLAPSCSRKPTPGMVVRTDTDRAIASRRLVIELLVADQPPRAAAHDAAAPFWYFAEAQGVTTSRFPTRHPAARQDLSHPAMAVNLDACIACNLCARACRDDSSRPTGVCASTRPSSSIPCCRWARGWEGRRQPRFGPRRLSLLQHSYTILDTSNDAVFLHVNHGGKKCVVPPPAS
jgi:predicted molibdopterin-dependent oxidoreductase YjgC